MELHDVAGTIRDSVEGKSKCVFFVGAGISKEGNLCEDFRGLNQRVMKFIAGEANDLNDYYNVNKIFENERARPEVVLQIAREEIGPEIITCLDILVGDNLNFYHHLMARALKAGNWVFTTNFENRIEKACEEIGFVPNICLTDEDYCNYMFKSKEAGRLIEGCLFKLHGTINEKESSIDKRYKTIVMTLKDVGKGLPRYKSEVLKNFIETYDFIFLGYSCTNEFDINEILLTTKSDKRIFYFQYDKSNQNEYPKIIIDKNFLENEMYIEDQSRSIIHINKLVLGRPEAYKIKGDPRKLIEEIFDSITNSLNHNKQIDNIIIKEIPMSWAQNIEEHKRRLFFGRILLHLGIWDDAIKCLSKIDGEEVVKAKAMRYIGDAWRLTEEMYGYDLAIESYKNASDIFEDHGYSALAAIAKAEMANVMRLAKKPIRNFEKYIDDAKLILEGDILPGYAAVLNIYGLIYNSKQSEDKWRRNYWLETAEDLCEKSMLIGQVIGDQARFSRSANALSLVKIEIAKVNQDRNKIIESIDLLERILPNREAASDLLLCFQINRNLGMAHNIKMDLAETNDEKIEEQRLSEEHYTNSKKYSNLGTKRIGQNLEIIFREGERLFKLEDYSKAMPKFEEYVKDQRIPYRKATGLMYLGDTYYKFGNIKMALESFEELVQIYENMEKIQNEMLIGSPEVRVRAKENLSKAIEFFEQINEGKFLYRAKYILSNISDRTP